tara:strand:- start:241 stop:999 length:759 start_codon:yes stop_codon:yes gene_type:complete
MKKLILILVLGVFFSADSNANEKNKSTKDCFEKLNRGVFAFNDSLDKALIKPLAKGYRSLPTPIRSGVSNSLNNLSNLLTIPNNVLQGEIKLAGQNTLRFVINTTIGIFGIFDPASNMGLAEYVKEDYGQTLGSWGIGPGCYLVLPILGPTTSRDLLGSFVGFTGGDAWYNVTVRNETQYFSDFDYYFSRAGSGIDFRSKNIESFDNLEENSIDFYASVKSLYLQDRKQKVLNSNIVVDTFDDSDWNDLETK